MKKGATPSDGLLVPRYEIADQGSGGAIAATGAAAGWTVGRVTIGGTYARRVRGIAGSNGPNSPSGGGAASLNYSVTAGFHAK